MKRKFQNNFLLTLGCERTMEANGYPWPPMLDCDKFPLDNDMCITSQAEAKQEKRPSQSKTIKTHGKQSLNTGSPNSNCTIPEACLSILG